MNVALVRAPCINLPYPPPVGLAYLNAVLKKAGHRVFIFDLNIEIFHIVDEADKKKWNIPDVPCLVQLGEEIYRKHSGVFQAYLEKIAQTGAEVIGFSVWDSNAGLSLQLAKECKKIMPGTKIIFGGPECFPGWSGLNFAGNDFIDAVVYGEGEETLEAICDYVRLTARTGLHSGTLVKHNGRIVDCGVRNPPQELDSLPFPDFDGFALEKYMTKELPIVFNRGCSRKCVYCSLPGTTPSFRSRSGRSIFEEIKCQTAKYPWADIFHCDSPALNSNLKELLEFCRLMLSEGTKVTWSGFAIIDKQMDAASLEKMYAAGCRGLNFGIESGSQKIVDSMRKGFRIADAENNLRDAHKLGIETVVNFIVGFPGEEEEDFQQTLDFVARNKANIDSVGSCTTCWIGPYTWLYSHAVDYAVTLSSSLQEWQSKDSDYPMRKAREERFKKFIADLHIGKSFPRLS